MKLIKDIKYKIDMYFEEKKYERAKRNEHLHGRVVKKGSSNKNTEKE